MKTLDEALDYLYSFINYETDASYAYGAVFYNVERTVKLLELLGNPEKGMRVVHVAGTKGKGSVCTLFAALLACRGVKTGLFTSPHVERVNERISVDGCEIEDGEFIELMDLFPPLIGRFPRENVPTTFEILTALAMEHYRRRGTQFVVLETGMGGRFDSTNFCDPVLSVVTPVSYDHTDKLGDTIEQIAFEKAGIIKKGKPAVVGYQRYGILPVLERKATEEGSRLYRTESLCRYDLRRLSSKGSLFDAVVDGISLEKLFLSLPGRHQVENAVTVLLGLKILDLLPPADAVRASLAQIRFPTRLELFEGPLRVRSGSGGGTRRVLLDSAHNEDSARVLVEALREAYRYGRLFTILGIVKGKDIRGIVQNLAPVSYELIVTEPKTHKELDTERVVREARALKPSALFIPDIRDAIEHAVSVSNADDLILVTGSFYATSPARSYLLRAFGPA